YSRLRALTAATSALHRLGSSEDCWCEAILCRVATTPEPTSGISRARQTPRTSAYAGMAGRLLPLSGMSDTFLNLGNPCRLSSEAAWLLPAVEEEEWRRSLVVV